MKEFLKREPVRRSIRTFVQAVAGYVVVNVASLDISATNALKGFIVAAIAAGIAAVMNRDGEHNDC